MTEDKALTERQRLEALAAFVPVFDSPDFVFGRWEQPPAEPDGSLRFAYFVPSPEAEAFLGEVGRGGWIINGFDWKAWNGTPEAVGLRRGDGFERATPIALARLLTALVRQDRFVEGTLVEAHESGLLRRIVARAAALTQSPLPPASHR
jgi:uncharacterized protein DUF6508